VFLVSCSVVLHWEKIKEKIKTAAKESLGLQELKQHKPWFDEECLGFLDQNAVDT
jgi:dsDNA-specific endonuclease/ATPase MutS2